MSKDYAPEVKKLVGRYQRKGLTFIRYNSKTLVSLDVDNMCPKAEAGNACVYCYRKDLQRCGRLTDKVYFGGSPSPELLTELRAFCKELRRIAPKLRSIRTFSLSDFRRRHMHFWQTVWRTIRRAGLRVHVITKQFDHVQHMVPYVDCMQLSIDSTDIHKWQQARLLRRQYPNVIIRTVVLSPADHGTVDMADLITVYHGNRIPDLATYRTNGTSHTALCKTIERAEGKKVCCVTGHCDTCKKCWYPKRLRK